MTCELPSGICSATTTHANVSVRAPACVCVFVAVQTAKLFLLHGVSTHTRKIQHSPEFIEFLGDQFSFRTIIAAVVRFSNKNSQKTEWNRAFYENTKKMHFSHVFFCACSVEWIFMCHGKFFVLVRVFGVEFPFMGIVMVLAESSRILLFVSFYCDISFISVTRTRLLRAFHIRCAHTHAHT